MSLSMGTPIVAIDARMVGNTLHGMARYVVLLCQGLAELKMSGKLGFEPLVIIQPGMSSKFVGLQTVEATSPFLNPRELFEIPRLLKSLKADLYHSPTFSSLISAPCPWLITIHDLNHLTYGGMIERLYYKFLLKPFAKRAQRVLSVSRYSADEIATWLEVENHWIEVVYNALDPSLSISMPDSEIETLLSDFGLKRNEYFFCLSNPKPHKNVGFLVEAYRQFRKNRLIGNHHDLVLTLSEYSTVPGVKSLGSIPEKQARALLQGAKALFFPSLYEGFGLPPVEAAALGVPVAVSDIPAHREALSPIPDAEITFLPIQDLGAWVQAFDRAARGELPHPSLHSRRTLLTRYSTDALASQMAGIYESVLRASPV